VGDFGSGHLEQDDVIGGRQRIGILEIDLILSVRVLMVDLIDVDTQYLQAFRHTLKKGADARKTAIVVSRLLQAVGIVERCDGAVRSTLQQAEFRFNAGIERPSAFGQARNLLFENVTRIKPVGGIVHGARSHDACVSRRPWQKFQRRKITNQHVFGFMGGKAHAEYAAARKADAVGKNVLQMIDWDGLALGNAIDVDELRQHIADVIFSKELLCFDEIEVFGRRELSRRFTPGPMVGMQHGLPRADVGTADCLLVRV